VGKGVSLLQEQYKTHTNNKEYTMKNLIVPAVLSAMTIAALAGGIGYNSKPTPEPVTIEKVVEKKVTVEKTPDACLEALTAAENVFGSAGRAMGYSQEALQAAARLDAAGIMKQKGSLDVETAYLETIAPKYQTASAQCRAK
jgi:hypothetical protein